MHSGLTSSQEVVALGGLLALLITAQRHPARWIEAGVSALAVIAVLAVGAVDLDATEDAVRRLLPVILFLAAILVITAVCHRTGLFAALGERLRFGPKRAGVLLLASSFGLGALVTTTLSLDATAVLLTPVVVGAAVRLGVPGRPSAFACLRMANSASLLLPVSNLTNLLALPFLSVGFLGFVRDFAPVFFVVLVVEWLALRWLFRHELAGVSPAAAPSVAPTEVTQIPLVPATAVALMLLGFVITSPWQIDPAWVAGATAVGLAGWALSTRVVRPPQLATALHLEFLALVLALAIVVAAVSEGFLGDAVRSLIPNADDTLGLASIALLATALANLLTNLSAALLLLPLVAPLGDIAIFAALIGLNIGSGLTYSGSLANLLWRRSLHQAGAQAPNAREFLRLSLPATVLSLTAATATLALLH